MNCIPLFARFALIGAIAACPLVAGSQPMGQPLRLGELNSYKVFPAFLEPYKKGMELAVAEINAGRAGAYRDIASKTNVTPEAAGIATARQLIARAPAGQFYRDDQGKWVKK